MVGVDVHIVMVPSPGGPVPTPMPLPFDGVLEDGLATTVMVEDKAVALEGSKAKNTPPHLPPGGSFQKPPKDEGTIQMGSSTVFINDKAVARAGDPALTCNDPADAPNGVVVAACTVMIDD